MNVCSNCGKMAGLHSSILPGCTCQYSMQAPPKREWVGLTKDEFVALHNELTVNLTGTYSTLDIYRAIEAKLKEKNT